MLILPYGSSIVAPRIRVRENLRKKVNKKTGARQKGSILPNMGFHYFSGWQASPPRLTPKD
jgi:hypothetical protein